jgi:hypothetical protein
MLKVGRANLRLRVLSGSEIVVNGESRAVVADVDDGILNVCEGAAVEDIVRGVVEVAEVLGGEEAGDLPLEPVKLAGRARLI